MSRAFTALLVVTIGLLAISCGCQEATPTGVDVVNLKVVFVNDHAVLSWETNISSTCKVSFCREGTCFITDPTPLETLHMIDLPKDASEVTIYITGNDESYVEVPVEF